MEIIIEGPTFQDQEDEDSFFNSIYALPGFLEVVGCGTELNLQIKDHINGEVLKKVLEICERWEIEREPIVRE